MSQPDNTLQNSTNCLTYFTAASAGVAQSVAFGTQNVVEEWRHRSIIQTTAMGNAYAKWLANPQTGESFFQPLLTSIQDNASANPLPDKLNQFIGMTLNGFS